jgi:hypothetical protein
VGQRLHLGRTDLPWITIVGIVGDTKQTSLALAQSDAVYVPAAQWYSPDRVRSLVVRTGGDPASLAGAVRRAVWSVDKNQPIVRGDDEWTAGVTAAERRFALMLFEAPAAALALAAIGILVSSRGRLPNGCARSACRRWARREARYPDADHAARNDEDRRRGCGGPDGRHRDEPRVDDMLFEVSPPIHQPTRPSSPCSLPSRQRRAGCRRGARFASIRP